VQNRDCNNAWLYELDLGKSKRLMGRDVQVARKQTTGSAGGTIVEGGQSPGG
jgi:hypothetical protein